MRTAVLLCAALFAAEAKDITFGGKNVLHPDRFTVVRVDDHRVQLDHGVVTFHIYDSAYRPVEIVTPTVTVQPFLVGEYRIEVTRFGETQVTPTGAQVRVVSPQGAEWVSPGQKMVVRGSAAAPEFRIVDAVGPLRRLANRISAAFNSFSFGGGNGGGTEEAAVSTGSSDDSPAKPAAPAQPDARTPNPNHPNEGVIQSPHPSRGK
jgi:hypothetical protein